MNRDTTQLISTILDEYLPPILRERRWFYKFVLQFAVKGDVDAYLDFRDNAWRMSDSDIQNLYASIKSNIDRPTDCNDMSVERVIGALRGESVLEFGCGRGYLAQKIIGAGKTYTGIDFDTSGARQACNGSGRFFDGTDVNSVASETFDTVVTTHTLEHVRDVRHTVETMRPLARRNLVIVVPLQLNLSYTPDLHIHYWRRPGDFLLAAGFEPCDRLSYHVDRGDLFVDLTVEDVAKDK